jgi:hypothetical protein
MASPRLLAVLAVLNVPMYVVVFRAFFDDFEELAGGLGALDPSLWARLLDALSGQWYDNQWAKAKLLVASVLCASLVLGEYSTVQQHAPALAHWLDHAW